MDHRNVSGLFGEDEERLAEFIATIAGAALEIVLARAAGLIVEPDVDDSTERGWLEM